MIARAQCIVASRFSINNEMIVETSYRIIVFCSLSLYCLILLKWRNLFKLVNSRTRRNRSFNWIDAAEFAIVFLVFFRFLDLAKLFSKTTSLIKAMHQLINLITTLLNNWWRISMFIKKWTLQYLWFHVQFFIEWTIMSLRSWLRIDFCLTSLTRIYFELRYFHFFDKSSRWFEKTLQMLQCRFFLMSIIRICSS